MSRQEKKIPKEIQLWFMLINLWVQMLFSYRTHLGGERQVVFRELMEGEIPIWRRTIELCWMPEKEGLCT